MRYVARMTGQYDRWELVVVQGRSCKVIAIGSKAEMVRAAVMSNAAER